MQIYGNGEKLLTDNDVPTNYWNLIDNSATFLNFNNLNASYERQLTTPNGNKALTKDTAWNFPKFNLNITEGQIYTFSMMARFDSNSNYSIMKLYPPAGGEYEPLKDTAFSVHNLTPNIWHKDYVVFKALKNATVTISIANSQDVRTDFGDYMVNKGTYPLDWNYSLNDLRSMMSANK